MPGSHLGPARAGGGRVPGRRPRSGGHARAAEGPDDVRRAEAEDAPLPQPQEDQRGQ